MPQFNGEIKGFVIGDNFRVIRNIFGIPAGENVTESYLTVKTSDADADAAAIFQKHVTTSLVSAEGQVGSAQSFTVTTTGNADAGTLTINLSAPLPVALPEGLEITFSGGETVTLKSAAKKRAKALAVEDNVGGVLAGETATIIYWPVTFHINRLNSVLITANANDQLYDIQVKTDQDNVYTPEKGKISGVTQITRTA